MPRASCVRAVSLRGMGTIDSVRAIGLWLDAEEVQSILVGFAIIASMPIAGSSTAWSQSVDGNMALSVGLVVSSVLRDRGVQPIIRRLGGLTAAAVLLGMPAVLAFSWVNGTVDLAF